MDKKDINMTVLHARMAKMYPVIDVNGELFRIRNVHPIDQCFTWEPKAVALVEGLVELRRIVTEHSCGFHGFFKPSIAEVIMSIPDDLVDKVVAFRTLTETAMAHPSGSYHLATTVLYTGTNVNPTVVPKMRLYTCTDHQCHWPVGVASIVLATDEDEARKLLYTALEKCGLTKHEAFTLEEVDMNIPSAYVLRDGEY